MTEVDRLIQKYIDFAKKLRSTEFSLDTSSDLLQEHVQLVIDMQKVLQTNPIDVSSLKKLQQVTNDVTDAFTSAPKKLNKTKIKKVSPNGK